MGLTNSAECDALTLSVAIKTTSVFDQYIRDLNPCVYTDAANDSATTLGFVLSPGRVRAVSQLLLSAHGKVPVRGFLHVGYHLVEIAKHCDQCVLPIKLVSHRLPK